MSDINKKLAALAPEQRQLLELLLLREAGIELAQSRISPRTRDSHVAPLSYAQQRLWFLDQLRPGNPAYNLPVGVHLAGPLDVAALRQSLREVVRRHETLRTTFTAVDGRPVQLIAAARESLLLLPVIFLQDLPASTREVYVQQLATAEALRPFDLTRGPLLRAVLLRLAPDEHTLLLTMHHIISDGWSGGVLMRELAALYEAFSRGRPSPLPALPIQYADYAVWQRQYLEGEGEQGNRRHETGDKRPEGTQNSKLLGSPDSLLQTQLAYWRRQLAGASPALELPSDRPRPTQQSFQGATRSLVFSSPLATPLAALSRQEGATLFMLLLAAFYVLLHRYSGRSDIVVGTPIANRVRAEQEGLIGFFANTLPLRADLSGDPTFRELAKRVREVCLGAYAHQDLPFERLVEELAHERDLSRTPLFQVEFILQTSPALNLGLSDLTLRPLEIDSGTAMFDLVLVMKETARGLEAALKYATDLFDGATVSRMLGHFQVVLGGIAADPDMRLSTLSLLTEAERRQVLVEWNDTATGGRSRASHSWCIHHLFEAQAERTPDAIALVFDFPDKETTRQRDKEITDRTTNDDSAFSLQLTYDELNRRANRLAHHLRGLGVAAEARVGIFMERSLELIVGILAVLKAGGAYVPLDPTYPQERLAFTLEDAQAAVLLTHERLADDLPATWALVVSLDGDAAQIARSWDTNPANELTAANAAYVIYTSGSTGHPKGVLVAHEGLCNLVAAQRRVFGIRQDNRVLQFASISFDASAFEIIMALMVGATLCLGPRDALLPGPPLLRFLRDHAITAATLTPTALAALPDADLPALHTVVSAGEACPLDLARRWAAGRRFFNAYGPTEATIWTTVAEGAGGYPSIGRPILNTQIYILDAALQPVPVGVPGELHIGGIGLARGYLNRPDLSAEKFVPNPWGSGFRGQGSEGIEPESDPRPLNPDPSLRLYKTGDLARWRDNGMIEFLGRIDAQVKIRGFRVELGEIEAALAQHPAVREAVVETREDQPGARRLVAYVVTTKDERRETSEERDSSTVHRPSSIVTELRAFLQTRLPDYMVPAAFVMLDALPLTPSGKVDRKALPAPGQVPHEHGSSFVAPRTPAEEQLAQIWRQVLGVQRVGVHDNFFDLGGDSILSIQIIARANQAGLGLAPRHLFQYPTIAGLAAAAGMSPAIPIEQGAVTGPLPLTPIQRWFFEQDLRDPHHWNQAVLLETRRALDRALVERVVWHLLAHHDALRLRFVRDESGWHQTVAAPDATTPFVQVDLSGLLADEQTTAIEAAASGLQASLDLSAGPLVRVALFDLGAQRPGRLLLIAHHLVVDGVSWRILLEDFPTAYAQLSRGEPVALPPKTTSFRDWAHWLHEHARSADARSTLADWLAAPGAQVASIPVDHRRPRLPIKRSAFLIHEGHEEHEDPVHMRRSNLRGLRGLRGFGRPDQHSRTNNTMVSAETVTATLSAEETRALLQEVPATAHAQIDEVLLAALAQTFTRWIGSRGLLIDLESHGRATRFNDMDLSRTVGWFTALFPMYLDLAEASDPGAALQSIKEQLRRLRGRELDYGLLRYLSTDLAIARQLRSQPQAQVTFNYLGQFDQALSEASLFRLAEEPIGPTRSPRAVRSHLIEINALVSEGRLALRWVYSAALHQRDMIERLAHEHTAAVRTLIAQCLSSVGVGYTPSDFPDTALSHADIAALMLEIDEAAATSEHRIEAVYPLSPMQQGMLFHSLYAPESGMYVEQLACTVRGDLDVAAFERAWRRTIKRHAVLRTAFVWERLDQMLQVVHLRVDVGLERLDWRASPEEQEAYLAPYLAADRRRGFKLARAPLIRLALIQVANDTYRFVWSYHHLLLDGWSVSLVLAEVFACYEAFRRDQDVSLEQPRPYRDYIAWLQRQDLSQAEAFWRKMLADVAAPTALGIDQARSRTQGAEAGYAERQARLSPATTDSLRSLARQRRLTLNTLVQSAWALLLSRYSGEEELVFGVTVSGRPTSLAGAESMIGLFINTLPLRARVSPEAPLLEWLQRFQEQQIELRQYEYTPLAQIQGWSATPRGVPLFESLVLFENYPVDTALRERRGNLEIRDVRSIERTNYPLTVMVAPGPGLEVRIIYDRGRFEAAAIARALGHIETLLQGIAAAPERRLADLPLLTEAERQQLLVNWNITRGQGSGVRSQLSESWCLHRLFEAQAARTPDAVALVFDLRDKQTSRQADKQITDRTTNDDSAFSLQPSAFSLQMTYAELNRRSNHLAHHLRALGVGPEARVGICLERSIELVVGLLGILKAGGAYVPLDPAYPAERLAFMLEDSQARVLITQQRLDDGRWTMDDESASAHPIVNRPPSIVNLAADWPLIAGMSAENLANRSHPDNLAYVLYTSGSTGQPKGVGCDHRGVANLLADFERRQPLRSGDGCSLWTSISFDVSVYEIFSALTVGGALHIAPERVRSDSTIFVEWLSTHRISSAYLPPFMLEELAAWLREQPRRSPLRRLLVGVEPIGERLLAAIGACLPALRIINGYGPTEATICATLYDVGAQAALDRNTPIGRPVQNTQIYILDPHLGPAPIGIAGELYIGGAGLARGYLNRPDLTAERFVPNPFADFGFWILDFGLDPIQNRVPRWGESKIQNGDRLYKTGDRARYLEDRNIEFLGRIDTQVKLRGYRVEPGEIEAALRQHPGVRDSVVVAHEVSPGARRLVAYVVPATDDRRWTMDDGSEHDSSSIVYRPSSLVTELRSFLQQQLPAYMLPSAFVPLAALPLTANGKVDRRALPAPDSLCTTQAAAYVAPRDALERTLAGIWREVLGGERVGVHDDFFALGGDSMLSIKVTARARRAGLPLTPRHLFEHPTIAGLASAIETAATPDDEQGLVTGPAPLSPIQQWFFELQFPDIHHWNTARLLEAPHPVDPRAVEQALRSLLLHHDALRLRFTRTAEGWRQAIAGPEVAVPLLRLDLSALPEDAQSPMIEAAASELQTSLDLEEGPLLRVALFDPGRQRPSRLLIIIHHLLVDSVSWQILMEDFQTAYVQLSRGEPIALPPKTTSFKRWTERLVEYARSDAARRESEYWLAQTRTPVARLPVDYPGGLNVEGSTRVIPVALTAEETRALLRRLASAPDISINDLLLAALLQTCTEWTGEHTLQLIVTAHGRDPLFDDMDVSRTVGWLSVHCPVLLERGTAATPGELLRTVQKQLRRIPHRGIGYDLLRYYSDDPALRAKLRAQPPVEVIFNYEGQFGQAGGEAAPFRLARESAGSVVTPQQGRPRVLHINSHIAGGRLRFEWGYSRNLHRRATVERLAWRHLDVIRSFIASYSL